MLCFRRHPIRAAQEAPQLRQEIERVWPIFLMWAGIFTLIGLAVGYIAGNQSASGDSSDGPSAQATVVVPTATVVLPPTATATATQVSFRRNCAEIRGTDYRNDAERDWFVANCTGPGPTSTPFLTATAGAAAATTPGAATGSATPGAGAATTPASGTPVPLTLVSLNTPVAVGANVTLSARTQPGISCSLTYNEPNGAASNAEGLGGKNADSSGLVSWTWRISPTAQPGNGTARIVCGSSTATLQIQTTAS
jgi:hypothetical protein